MRQDVYKSAKIETLPYADDLDMAAVKQIFARNSANAVEFLVLYSYLW